MGFGRMFNENSWSQIHEKILYYSPKSMNVNVQGQHCLRVRWCNFALLTLTQEELSANFENFSQNQTKLLHSALI